MAQPASVTKYKLSTRRLMSYPNVRRKGQVLLAHRRKVDYYRQLKDTMSFWKGIRWCDQANYNSTHKRGDEIFTVMVKVTEPVATELDTFLPQDGSDIKDGAFTGKYKVQVAATARDVESSRQTLGDGKEFDPFKERQVDKPTTDCDTLTHLLKASLGTGILGMPFAFKSAGLVVGLFLTIFVSIICTHCAYVLVKCGHKLYYKTRKTAMTFSEVAQYSFQNGPDWAKPFATTIRYIIQISLFITYYGTCSVYSVIISQNLKDVIDQWTSGNVSIQLILAILIAPLILLSWVPNLRYLAPISMIANLCMAVGLGITFYYLVWDMPPVTSVPYVAEISTLPLFFSITIFAIEAIGVVMPLENSMKTPQHFVGICGVLNKGMSGVTLIYILLGFLGYVRYGPSTHENIIMNLDSKEPLAQAVKILIAIAVYCTFGLQFYVCLEIAWNGIKEKFTKQPLIANYVLRTVMVIGAVLLAIAVPEISPFMGLLGAFCFSILGLIIPLCIEIVVSWDEGFGPGNWVLIKNIIICIFGLLVLGFGSHRAVLDIIKTVKKMLD